MDQRERPFPGIIPTLLPSGKEGEESCRADRFERQARPGVTFLRADNGEVCPSPRSGKFASLIPLLG